MASTLLAAPCFLSLQNREVGGFLRSFRSPNYDKVKYNQGLLRTRIVAPMVVAALLWPQWLFT
ncbi:unnamed protein product [Prunus armeniaca]|uniref:Uncharacterized protein n=1 Tax=Prunus armeniaca TaxID=36596 RepID=A0A6J5XZ51_PRUAR|nr:unnamed protein product [Prunus armeniaca]